jgi:hypothetical protein
MYNNRVDIDKLCELVNNGAIKRGEITEDEVIDCLISDIKRWNDDTLPMPEIYYAVSRAD